MIIAVAGPYSNPTEDGRRRNLDALNEIAGALLLLGHAPLIGVNAALPVVDKTQLEGPERYEGIMSISMAVMKPCEAVLIIGESPGVTRERDHFIAEGLPVFYSIEEVVRYTGRE